MNDFTQYGVVGLIAWMAIKEAFAFARSRRNGNGNGTGQYITRQDMQEVLSQIATVHLRIDSLTTLVSTLQSTCATAIATIDRGVLPRLDEYGNRLISVERETRSGGRG